MDSSRIIGIHQTRNQLGIQSINNNNLNEAIGRLLYFQENQKREGVAVLVSPQHIITPIVNILSPHSKEFSVKDSFVFQASNGEYVGVKEIFFEKTFQYDEWNEASIADQQYCCCAIMLLEKQIRNVRHTGIISIFDYNDFFSVHTNKNIYIPTGNNDSTQIINNYEQDKSFLAFDINPQNSSQDSKKNDLFKITTQVPVFVNDVENLGGLCLIGFAQQHYQTTKFQTWILSKDNFEDIHKWLNGQNASFTIDYEMTIDSCRNFKSKELKDSKNAQAHQGKISNLFKLEKYYAASCSEDKQIKVWNWRTGKLKKVFKTDRPCKLVFGINEYLIGVEGNMMIIIDWKNKKVLNISTHSFEINIVLPVKNKIDKIQRIILIDNQNGIYLFRFDFKEKNFQFERQLLKWDLQNDQINQCQIYTDQHIIFTTSNSGNISILNWLSGTEERRFDTKDNGQQQQSGIVCIMVHPQSNNYIFVSYQNGTFGVWDVERGTLALKIANFSTPIQTICKQSQNQIVISDGKDFQLLFINQVLSFTSKKYSSFHFSQINYVLYLDDEFFLTSDVSGRLRIWQLEQPYLLPDGIIGTQGNPEFNILQCPELNSLNNSLSSATAYNQQYYQNGQQFYQNENYNNQITNQIYQQEIVIHNNQQNPQQMVINNNQQNSLVKNNQQNILSNNIPKIYINQPQNNIYHQTDYQYDDSNQKQNDIFQNVQNQEEQQVQTQNLDQKDQTFSNSKFGKDQIDGVDNQGNQQINRQQEEILKIDNNQISGNKQDEEYHEYDERTPKFNPNSIENITNDKNKQIMATKMKMYNIEEAFNQKRKEQENQQQQGRQIMYDNDSQNHSLQQQNEQNNYNSNLQQIEGRKLTQAQHQLIESDRSVQSEFSLCKQYRKNSRENDHEDLQPDQIGEQQFIQGDQERGEQETISLIENMNDSKEKQQIQQNLEGQLKDPNNFHNYNSIVSNASEQYLTQIHSHLSYPGNQISNNEQYINMQRQQNNDQLYQQNIQKSYLININNADQIRNTINQLNQKLIEMNQPTQIQQPYDQQELQFNQQNSHLSQEEEKELRLEVENLKLQINDYKKLNDSLEINYQIIVKKFNLELQRSSNEKQQKIEILTELGELKEELQYQRQINSQFESEINDVKEQLILESQEKKQLQQESENIILQNQELNQQIQNIQNGMQQKIQDLENLYQTEIKQNEILQNDYQLVLQKNEELNQQIQVIQNEMEQKIRNLEEKQTNQEKFKEQFQYENQNIIKQNEELNSQIQELNQQNKQLNLQVQDMQNEKQNLINEQININQEKQQVILHNQDLLIENSNFKRENQNLQNLNEELTKKNGDLAEDLSQIEKEKICISNNLEQMNQQNSNLNKEFTDFKNNNTQLQQDFQNLQHEFSSYIQQIESNKISQLNDKDQFIEKINQIIQDQASEKFLITFTDSIKNLGLTTKELESIQKNVYESQIDEYQKENQRISIQFSTIDATNQNLINEIDTMKKESDKLKSDLRRSKDSVEHWLRQYNVQLDREKLQSRNIESKEELILLLKQEIEKLNSLYQQQLQEQINQNNNQVYNNATLEFYKKELLIDEWNSLLSLIDNESIAQFSRIEQTNRKSEKPISANASHPHTYQTKNQSLIQNKYQQQINETNKPSKQIYITNDLQISQSSAVPITPTQQNTLALQTNLSQQQTTDQSFIPTQLQTPTKCYTPTSKHTSALLSTPLSHSSKNPLLEKLQEQSSSQLKKSNSQIIQNQNQQYQEVKILQNINQNPSQTTKNYNGDSMGDYLQKNVSQNTETQQQNENLKIIQNNSNTNQNQYPNNQQAAQIYSAQQQTPNSLILTNKNQNQYSMKNSLSFTNNQNNNTNINKPPSINLSILQNKNNQIQSNESNLKSKDVQGNLSNIDNQQETNFSQNQGNTNSHIRSKSDINSTEIPYSAKFKQQEENNDQINQNLTQENNPYYSDNKDISSKSPSQLHHNNSIQSNVQSNQNNYQQYFSLGQNNNITNGNNSYNVNNNKVYNNYTRDNSNNINNNIQIEKSERVVSGLQNLKNIKKNISLSNISSQPISTLNIGSISPCQYNDSPSEFIKRQIEQQQQAQLTDKKFESSYFLRSLTPQPERKQHGTSSNSTPFQVSSQQTPAINSQVYQNIRKETLNPQLNKQQDDQLQNYTKNYNSLSPYGRISSTPVTNIGDIIYSKQIQNESQKQISFTPSVLINKKQKIQEALKTTYIDKDKKCEPYMSNYTQDQNSMNYRCKTEDPNSMQTFEKKDGLQYQNQSQVQSNFNCYNSCISPINNQNDQYQSITPSDLIKQSSTPSNSQISPQPLKNDSIHTSSYKNLLSNQSVLQNSNQKQSNYFSDVKQPLKSSSTNNLSLQKNQSNQEQFFSNNKGIVSQNSNQNYTQSFTTKYNDQDIIITKLNFDYAQQNNNNNCQVTPSSISSYSPHSQGNLFSQKKTNIDNDKFIKKNEVNQGNSTPNYNLQNINDDKSQQNATIVKNPLYRNYAVN